MFFKTHLFWRCLNTSGGVLRRHEGDPPMGALPPPPLLLPLLSFPLLPPPLPSHRLLLHFAGLLSLPSLEILPLYGGRSLSSYSHNPSPSGPPVNKYFERGWGGRGGAETQCGTPLGDRIFHLFVEHSSKVIKSVQELWMLFMVRGWMCNGA